MIMPILYVIIMSPTSFRVNPHSIVCLNVKEFLARSRHHISSLSDSNEIRTYNHLVRKRTLNHLAKLASLAKWLSIRLRTKWLWVPISLLSHNADSFAASLLILYCSFSSLTLSSIWMIGFYIFFLKILKRKGLSDARVVSITKKEYDFEIHFLQRFVKFHSQYLTID